MQFSQCCISYDFSSAYFFTYSVRLRSKAFAEQTVNCTCITCEFPLLRLHSVFLCVWFGHSFGQIDRFKSKQHLFSLVGQISCLVGWITFNGSGKFSTQACSTRHLPFPDGLVVKEIYKSELVRRLSISSVRNE